MPLNPMNFNRALAPVSNRGSAPLWLLTALVNWGKTAPDEIFAPNRVPVDAYTAIKSSLGQEIVKDQMGNWVYGWENLMHRKAAMLELMRVHAGLESSWNPKEGVDRTNATSQRNKTGEETGLFQVSFDSTWLDSIEGKDIMGKFANAHGLTTPEKFIAAMKDNEDGEALEFEYYARLVRVSIAWAGPLLRHGPDSVYPYLNRASMAELWNAML